MHPNQPITLTLSWQTVQIISAALHEVPFRVSSPILAELQKQVMAQIDDNVGSTPLSAEVSSAA